MKTENFSLASATDVFMRNGMVRVLRYDSGAASGGVTASIRVTSLSGGDLDIEMNPGRCVTLPQAVKGIVIRNNSAGAVLTGKFTYGDGTVTDDAVIGSVGLDASTVAALIAGKYNVRPEEPSGTFNSSAVLAANAVTALFTPAANVAGALLLSAQAWDRTSGVLGVTCILAKNAAPININDGDPVFVSGGVYEEGAAIGIGGALKIPQYIPPGLGAYFMANYATTASSIRAARWKLL